PPPAARGGARPSAGVPRFWGGGTAPRAGLSLPLERRPPYSRGSPSRLRRTQGRGEMIEGPEKLPAGARGQGRKRSTMSSSQSQLWETVDVIREADGRYGREAYFLVM